MKLLILKAAAIGALVLVLLVALSMVQGVVNERRALKQQVEMNIAETSAGPQKLKEPVLVIPYRERVTEWEPDSKGEKRVVTKEYQRHQVIVPESLVVEGVAEVTPRRRGLYRAMQYLVGGRLDATFRVPVGLGVDRSKGNIALEPAFLAIGITDVHGFQSPPRLEWNGSTLTAKPGTGLAALGSGIHATIGMPDPARDHAFELRTKLVQAERALKYGVLFIGLTFAAFFLFELLRRLRIHPLQYGLVGLALTIFYLLLVSLSEHVAFRVACATASTACVVLLTYYLAHVLGGWRAGIAFGSQLALLYGVLYGLLQSEDNALVLGSVLLFAILAVVMVVTRRIDWYALTERAVPAEAAAES